MLELPEDDAIACEKPEETESSELPSEQIAVAIRSLISRLNASELMNAYLSAPGEERGKTILLSETIDVAGNKIQFDLLRWDISYKGEKDGLYFDVSIPGMKSWIAAFDFIRSITDEREEWEMKHRKVHPGFEGKGIASAILSFAEGMFKSQNNKRSKCITASVAQGDVMNWMLSQSRGFIAASPADELKIERVKSMEGLVAVKGNEDASFLFDADGFAEKFPELSGPEDPRVWKAENYKQPFYVLKSSFRVNLIKSLD